MRRVRSILALDRDRRRLLLEAALCLGFAGAAVRWVPFRWFAGSLGRARAGPSRDEPLERLPTPERIAWAIGLASSHLPWTSTCLMRAMAGQWMLRRRGVRATVHLGLARDETSGELLAHAWLRSGGRVLIGEEALRRRYTAIGTFSTDEHHT